MAASATGVLSPDDLNRTDKEVLGVLAGGRVTPRFVADELDVSRTYASERLKRLVEHRHVEKVAPGLYELVDDPREEAGTDADPEVEQLRERVRELNAQLEAAREGDTDVPTDELEDARTFLDRALDALPEDVPGRSAAADAKAVLDRTLGSREGR